MSLESIKHPIPKSDIRHRQRGFRLEEYEANMTESIRKNEDERLAFLAAAARMSTDIVHPVPVGQFRLAPVSNNILEVKDLDA
jgi:hypothetical protein